MGPACGARSSVWLAGTERRGRHWRRCGDGYFTASTCATAGRARATATSLDGVGPSCPTPASRSQPDGVHGPSEVVDLAAHRWRDAGFGPAPLRDSVIYELHVGTFTEAGTFDAAVAVLDELVELGVTAVELMPVAQFPGRRNWGYDGVFPFAVQRLLRRAPPGCSVRRRLPSRGTSPWSSTWSTTTSVPRATS